MWLLTEEGTKVVIEQTKTKCCTARRTIRSGVKSVGGVDLGGGRLAVARMGKRQKSIGGEGFQIVFLMGHWAKPPSDD